MAQVDLRIGGRQYKVACKDGGEDRLRRVAAHVDEKAAIALRSVGSASEERTLLMAALLVAEELEQLRTATAPAVDPRLLEGLAALAIRLETLGDRVEAERRAP